MAMAMAIGPIIDARRRESGNVHGAERIDASGSAAEPKAVPSVLMTVLREVIAGFLLDEYR
jgi:hypothetical protein